METIRSQYWHYSLSLLRYLGLCSADSATVLAARGLSRVVPRVLLQGRAHHPRCATPRRARLGEPIRDRRTVDTSDAQADVREKYQGFLITDSHDQDRWVRAGKRSVRIPALVTTAGLCFGSERQRDLFPAGAQTRRCNDRGRNDEQSGGGIRLYAGRSYVTIAAN